MTDIPIRLAKETPTTITLAFDPVEGALGYRFYGDDKPLSVTMDPAHATVRFRKGPKAFAVVALGKIAAGTYPSGNTTPDPDPQPDTGEQIIGLDLGGWGGPVFAEIKKSGIGYYRTNGNGRPLTADAIRAGLKVGTTCFGEGGSLGELARNASDYAADIRDYVVKYHPLHVEVINEPEGDWFWDDAGNAQAVATLVKATRAALAGITGTKIGVSVQDHDGWQQKILATDAMQHADEGIMHPYGGSTKSQRSADGDRDGITRAFAKLGGKKLNLSEVGWPTAVGKPSTGDSAQWTLEEQTANIVSFCKWVRANPQMISYMSLFMYNDYGSNAYYGIAYENGTHKPSWAEFAKWAND